MARKNTLLVILSLFYYFVLVFSYLTQDDIREITDFVQNVKNDYEEFDSNEHLVGQLPFDKHSKIQTNSYAGYINIRSFETTEGKGNSSLSVLLLLLSSSIN